MLSKSLVIVVLLGVTLVQSLIPLPSSNNPQSETQSENFRDSVAKAIRENVARLRARANGNVQVIEYPGTNGNSVDHSTYVAVPQPEVKPPPRTTPSLIAPIVRLPLPTIRQPVTSPPTPTPVVHQPVVLRTEPTTVRQRVPVPTIAVEDNRINTDDQTGQTLLQQELNEQAANARYSFDSSVQDTINDHSHTRQETRDGLALRGMYAYSDGFFRRTVHYAADEGGYRVTKEEIEPIGDGPQYNPSGKADVSTSLTGSYSITADDFKRKLPSVDIQ